MNKRYDSGESRTKHTVSNWIATVALGCAIVFAMATTSSIT